MPRPAAGLGHGDGRRRGDVQRPDASGLRDVGDRIAAATSATPGRRFRAVKVTLEPGSLERSLRELGWVIEVKPLAGPFLLGL